MAVTAVTATISAEVAAEGAAKSEWVAWVETVVLGLAEVVGPVPFTPLIPEVMAVLAAEPAVAEAVVKRPAVPASAALVVETGQTAILGTQAVGSAQVAQSLPALVPR
jgi:hypothetical protein